MYKNRFLLIALGGSLVCLLAFGYIFFYQFSLANRLDDISLKSDKNNLNIASTSAALVQIEERLARLGDEITALIEVLDEEKERGKSLEKAVEDQIETIQSTVGTLDALSKTDPELLKKYSRTYFLNENYSPKSLAEINKEYLLETNRTLRFHAQALPYLNEMIIDAKSDDIDLRIVSAYRSFGDQAALKAGYLVRYGTGANQFSADQGYSEHQLGTTVDFTTPALRGNFEAFGASEAYGWLKQNAYKSGFILSYPDQNSFYQYEPWHWRFVGVDLATRLHRDNKDFYEMDQRTIDSYLSVIFN